MSRSMNTRNRVVVFMGSVVVLFVLCAMPKAQGQGTSTTRCSENGIQYSKVVETTKFLAEGSVSVGERKVSGLGYKEVSSSTTYRIQDDGKEVKVRTETRDAFVLPLAEAVEYQILDQPTETWTEGSTSSIREDGEVVAGDRKVSESGMRTVGTETVWKFVKESEKAQKGPEMKTVSINRFEITASGILLGSWKRDVETFKDEKKTVTYDLHSVGVVKTRTVGTITTTVVVNGEEVSQTEKVEDTIEGETLTNGSVSVGERKVSGLGFKEVSSRTTYRIQDDGKEVEIRTETRDAFVLPLAEAVAVEYQILDQSTETWTEGITGSIREDGEVVAGDHKVSESGIRTVGTETVWKFTKESEKVQRGPEVKTVSINRFEITVFGTLRGSWKRDVETFKDEKKTVTYDLHTVEGRTVGTITTTVVVNGEEVSQTEKVDTTAGKKEE